jgi:hypothetical protein
MFVAINMLFMGIILQVFGLNSTIFGNRSTEAVNQTSINTNQNHLFPNGTLIDSYSGHDSSQLVPTQSTAIIGTLLIDIALIIGYNFMIIVVLRIFFFSQPSQSKRVKVNLLIERELTPEEIENRVESFRLAIIRRNKPFMDERMAKASVDELEQKASNTEANVNAVVTETLK